MTLLRPVLSAILLLPALAQSQVTVTTLREFSFQPSTFSEARIAFDRRFMYVSNPNGELFRARTIRPITPLEPIFSAEAINQLVIGEDDALYVLTYTDAVPQGQPPAHSIFKSTDHGSSFTPVDKGLLYCSFGYCQYLWATELIAEENRLFSNAGAGYNLLVSGNEGDTWKPLAGTLDSNVCTNSAFEISGQTVVQGGECPLDRAFLQRGVLAPNKLHWLPGQDLKPVQKPDIGNRNVITIKAMPGAPVFLAGIEGGILRSLDDGLSFSFVLKKTQEDGEYPYIGHILYPSRSPGYVVAAGFDKAVGHPYLTVSDNFGSHWTDVSHLLPDPTDAASVTGLAEDPLGRIIFVITDETASKVILARIQLKP